ncbi:hypothetical protein RUND412_009609 [Rhizina undulata]
MPRIRDHDEYDEARVPLTSEVPYDHHHDDLHHEPKRPRLIPGCPALVGIVLGSISFLVILLSATRMFVGGFDFLQSTATSPAVTTTTTTAAIEAEPTNIAGGIDQSFRRDPSEYVLDVTGWDYDAAPTVRSYNWTISLMDANPDAGITRPMLLVNEKFPGPLIRVNENDTIIVEVHNSSPNSTIIHFHGLLHQETPHMDGVPGVTSCPVPPGRSFTYEFKVTGQYGTYWWHAHFGTTRADGVWGPLIIHSPRERQAVTVDGKEGKWEKEQIVMVSDHYHDLSAGLLMEYLAPDNENAEPIPNGGLINGKNVHDCNDPRTKKANRTCDVSAASLSVFNFDPEKAHRIRFINTGAFAELDVSIDEHSMSLIEVDGTEVVPESINRLRINVAQRYSVILPPRGKKENANGKEGNGFWLRARMLPHCFAEIPKGLETEVKAIINYSPNPDIEHPPPEPKSKDFGPSQDLECKDLNLSSVYPLRPLTLPEPDILVPFRLNFEIGAYKLSRGFVNRTTFRANFTSPIMLRAMDGLLSTAPSAGKESAGTGVVMQGVSEHELVYSLQKGSVVDLMVENFDDGSHPFHLHGHRFWVLDHGLGYPNMSLYPPPVNRPPSSSGSPASGYLQRDTATIEAFGWMLIRFVADKPGAWFAHCHLAWHNEAGMGLVFLTGVEELTEGRGRFEGVGEMCKDWAGEQRGGWSDKMFEW